MEKDEPKRYQEGEIIWEGRAQGVDFKYVADGKGSYRMFVLKNEKWVEVDLRRPDREDAKNSKNLF